MEGGYGVDAEGGSEYRIYSYLFLGVTTAHGRYMGFWMAGRGHGLVAREWDKGGFGYCDGFTTSLVEHETSGDITCHRGWEDTIARRETALETYLTDIPEIRYDTGS